VTEGNEKRLPLFDPEFVERRSNVLHVLTPTALTPNVPRGGESKADAEKGFLKSKVETTRKTAESRANPEKNT
jgi:hypothetical protein